MDILDLIFKILAIIIGAFVATIIASIAFVLHIIHVASENDKERFWGENNPNKPKNNQ